MTTVGEPGEVKGRYARQVARSVACLTGEIVHMVKV